ncbi:MAG: hypothetical protein A2Y17_02880 [Clostridiales bacterium GWF2_38_85]|nr:MAG: hypothetical protein A2Y17_02880 [Clostridiales bacterium GWF2_38_85]
MRKILSIIFIFIIIVNISACKSVEVPPIQDIVDEITSNVTFTELYPASDDTILQDMGIKTDMFTEKVSLLPSDALQANRIFIFKATDDNNSQIIYDKLDKYLGVQKTRSQDYSPAMYAIFNKTGVVRKGLFVYLIVNDDISTATNIIKKYIK